MRSVLRANIIHKVLRAKLMRQLFSARKSQALSTPAQITDNMLTRRVVVHIQFYPTHQRQTSEEWADESGDFELQAEEEGEEEKEQGGREAEEENEEEEEKTKHDEQNLKQHAQNMKLAQRRFEEQQQQYLRLRPLPQQQAVLQQQHPHNGQQYLAHSLSPGYPHTHAPTSSQRPLYLKQIVVPAQMQPRTPPPDQLQSEREESSISKRTTMSPAPTHSAAAHTHADSNKHKNMQLETHNDIRATSRLSQNVLGHSTSLFTLRATTAGNGDGERNGVEEVDELSLLSDTRYAKKQVGHFTGLSVHI